jgi:hypothetical protein
LQNISTGIERHKHGTIRLVQTPNNKEEEEAARRRRSRSRTVDVPRWTAIWTIPIFNSWAFSNIAAMMTGWNSSSNMKGSVYGEKRNSKCRKSTTAGVKKAIHFHFNARRRLCSQFLVPHDRYSAFMKGVCTQCTQQKERSNKHTQIARVQGRRLTFCKIIILLFHSLQEPARPGPKAVRRYIP